MLLLPLGQAASVPELLEESMPARMDLEIERPFEKWWLIGAFNWSGRRRAVELALPAGRWHAFELWESRYLGSSQRRLRIEDVPAHGARLVALRRALGHPQLVGTTFHYSMGGAEVGRAKYDPRRQELRIEMQPVAKKHGEVHIHAPRGYRLTSATFAGEPVEPVRRQGRALAFKFALPVPASLAMHFA
jgi:hypothetical protein